MGHVDVAGVRYELPDGRVLLDEVAFRIGEGAKVALVGANGSGKTTLLRIITGDLAPHAGAVTRSGGLGVMRQFVGQGVVDGAEDPTVADLLLSVAPSRVQAAAATVDACERALMDADDTDTQLRYASALAEFADAGGYDLEVVWDVCTTAALGVPYDRAKYRSLSTLSGGEQKRLVLEYLLRGPDEVLLLDEPDNYLDVPGKTWLEERIAESGKTILFVSHDRELLANAATRIVTVELGAAGNRVWTHPRWVRDLPRGPARPVRAVRRAAPPLGRGAREAAHAGGDPEAEGDLQRRDGEPIPGGADPAAEVRGGRPAGRAAARTAGADAADRRTDGEARGGVRAAGVAAGAGGVGGRGADASVRPGGLVRRAGGGARLERVGQVALPAAAGAGRLAAGPGARAGRGAGCDRRRGAHRTGEARRAGASGLVRADP